MKATMATRPTRRKQVIQQLFDIARERLRTEGWKKGLQPDDQITSMMLETTDEDGQPLTLIFYPDGSSSELRANGDFIFHDNEVPAVRC